MYEWEKSNTCHHEAECAYVCQRQLVPLVVQPRYKARIWLRFIIGAAISVDFTKHEFDKAFGMLEVEMRATDKVTESSTTRSAALAKQVSTMYDGASLLRLYHKLKSNGDKDTLRMLQDDCERSSSTSQLKLTLTEFIRFQSELDKRIEKDAVLKNKTTEKKLKPATTCTVV